MSLTDTQLKDLKTAKVELEKLNKYHRKDNREGIQDFGYINSLGYPTNEKGQICIYRVEHWEDGVRAVYHAIRDTWNYTHHKPHDRHESFPFIRKVTEEVGRAFLSYIFSPDISPYRSLLDWGIEDEGRDIYSVDYLLEHGFILLNTAKPTVGVAHLLATLRDPYEHARAITTWHRYVKDGVDPHLAMMACRCGFFKENEQFQVDHRTHAAFSIISKDEIKKSYFMMRDSKPRYKPAYHLCNDTEYSPEGDSLNNMFSGGERYYNDFITDIPNKYTSSTTRRNHATFTPYDEIVKRSVNYENVVNYLMELRKELNQ
jgi:hypothetical protein